MARIVPLLGLALTVLALSGNNLVSSQSQANIKLVNNRYTGLLVAISDTIPYDPTLLDKIKVKSELHRRYEVN